MPILELPELVGDNGFIFETGPFVGSAKKKLGKLAAQHRAAYKAITANWPDIAETLKNLYAAMRERVRGAATRTPRVDAVI